MANLAAGKLPLESEWVNAKEATNGKITGYNENKGFAHGKFPISFTIDLDSSKSITIIRFLLWDNLGNLSLNSTRDKRQYFYKLLTSNDLSNWDTHYETLGIGYNGWQLFAFTTAITARYIRIEFINNTANDQIHLIEFEVYASSQVRDISPAIPTNIQNLSAPLINKSELEEQLIKTLDIKFSALADQSSVILEKAKFDGSAVESLKTELENKVKLFESAISQLGIIGQSLHFHEEAKKNITKANKWFIGIILSFIFFIVTILCFLFGDHNKFIKISSEVSHELNNNPTLQSQTLLFESISFFATKIVFVSILIYGIAFCIRNHRVQKHNYTVNQHKAMSLSSAVQFLDNSKLDEATRLKILIKATDTIFSHQHSGFADSNGDEFPNIISNIVETAK